MFQMRPRFFVAAAVLGMSLMLPVAVQAAPPVQSLAGFSALEQVRHGNRGARTRVRVYRGYASHDFPYGPPVRGFYDRNPAYQGNLNGCVVDLGYGRYESCNVGR